MTEPTPTLVARSGPGADPGGFAPDLDVVLCTYNPRRDVLAICLRALAAQDLDHRRYRVVVVDNNSRVPLSAEDLAPLTAGGVTWTLVREPRPGLVKARFTGQQQTTADWIVWVDDDNELVSGYLSETLRAIAEVPRLGVFGGRQRLPAGLKPGTWPKAWIAPMLQYLAIKDHGEEPQVAYDGRYHPWEPIGAGLVTRRDVMDVFWERIVTGPGVPARTGDKDLSAGEDVLMARAARMLGLGIAYRPALVIDHHLMPSRFEFRYLMRLMYAFGTSLAKLDRLQDASGLRAGTPAAGGGSPWRGAYRLARTFARSPLHAAGLCALRYGRLRERRRLAAEVTAGGRLRGGAT